MRAVSAVGLFAAFALAGCGAAPHAVDWRAEAAPLRDYPDSYQRLYVRNVTVDEISPVDTRSEALPGERLSVDPRIVRGVVREAITGMGLFREVVDVDANAVPGTGGLVLDIAFENAALVHAGENGSARSAFWLWFFTGLPGLYVRDQLYEFRADARAQVLDAATGDVLVPWEPLAALPEEPWALNFHERTKGLVPYLKTPIIPPYVIATDDREILHEILPATIKPPITNLVALFNQIRFRPVNRVEFHPIVAPGVRIESIRAPRVAVPEVAGDFVNLSLVLWIDEGLKVLRKVRVGGQTRLDLNEVRKITSRARAELALGEVALVAGDELMVELVLEGQEQPVKVLAIRSVPTSDFHPERRVE